MLETIRQYGAERLAEIGEEDLLRRRHYDFYLRLAEQSDLDSAGPQQAVWLKRLAAERPNLWAALGYSLTIPREHRAALRLASALWFYWLGLGLVRDGRHWLGAALAAEDEPCPERARALWLSGWIASLQGDHAASRELLTEVRELAGKLGDETELTYGVQYLGEAEIFANNVARAKPLVYEALARHRATANWTAPALLVFAQCARVAFLRGTSRKPSRCSRSATRSALCSGSAGSGRGSHGIWPSSGGGWANTARPRHAFSIRCALRRTSVINWACRTRLTCSRGSGRRTGQFGPRAGPPCYSG